MSDFYSDIAKVANGIMTGTGALVGKGGGESASVLMATAKVIIKGTEVVGDVIKLARLKPGAVVVPHLCRVIGAATGAAFSVKVGTNTAGEDAAYSAALDIKAAHDLPFVNGIKLPVKKDEPYWVTASITAATTPSAGAETHFLIAYRILG